MPEGTRITITLEGNTALLLVLLAKLRGCDVDAMVDRLVRREAKRVGMPAQPKPSPPNRGSAAHRPPQLANRVALAIIDGIGAPMGPRDDDPRSGAGERGAENPTDRRGF